MLGELKELGPLASGVIVLSFFGLLGPGLLILAVFYPQLLALDFLKLSGLALGITVPFSIVNTFLAVKFFEALNSTYHPGVTWGVGLVVSSFVWYPPLVVRMFQEFSPQTLASVCLLLELVFVVFLVIQIRIAKKNLRATQEQS